MSLLNVSLLLCCVNKLAKVLAGWSLCLASLRGMHLSLGSLKVFLFFFFKFCPKSVFQWRSEWHSGVQSGCRISWLWVSLCGITRVSPMSSAFGCSNLKYHNLKWRWALSYWFSLEESEISYTSKFPRYENWSSWNSRNKWIERLQLMNFWTKKLSSAKES